MDNPFSGDGQSPFSSPFQNQAGQAGGIKPFTAVDLAPAGPASTLNPPGPGKPAPSPFLDSPFNGAFLNRDNTAPAAAHVPIAADSFAPRAASIATPSQDYSPVAHGQPAAAQSSPAQTNPRATTVLPSLQPMPAPMPAAPQAMPAPAPSIQPYPAPAAPQAAPAPAASPFQAMAAMQSAAQAMPAKPAPAVSAPTHLAAALHAQPEPPAAARKSQIIPASALIQSDKPEFFMTGTASIDNQPIAEYLGVVSVEIVLPKDLLFRNPAPYGEMHRIKAAEDQLQKVKEKALEELAERARKLQADAVVGVTIQFSQFDAIVCLCSAVGTAVKLSD